MKSQERCAHYLRKSRQAGLDLGDAFELRRILGDLTRFVRARADKRQVPPEYVPCLRELVEPEFAQEPADLRQARVVLYFKKRPVPPLI